MTPQSRDRMNQRMGGSPIRTTHSHPLLRQIRDRQLDLFVRKISVRHRNTTVGWVPGKRLPLRGPSHQGGESRFAESAAIMQFITTFSTTRISSAIGSIIAISGTATS
jgi:hypothetical protein